MADLKKISERFPRIALIGVSLDDAVPGSREETKLKVAAFLRDRGVKYRNVYFTGRQVELTDRFNFEGELQVTIVYGPDGKELTPVVGQTEEELAVGTKAPGFNREVIRYRGYIDHSAKPEVRQHARLTNALDARLAGREVEQTATKAFGCSIKFRRTS